MTTDVANDVEYSLPEDWRGKVMTQIRTLIKQADPEIIEDVKWKTPSNPDGVLVWYREGMISTGEIYKKHIRLALAKGPALKEHDPKGLINTYRAIIIHENDKLDKKAFTDLIRAAVALNHKGKNKS